MKTFLYCTAITLLFTAQVSAKRVAPAPVAPVTTADAVISVPHFAKGERTQNGGVLEAHHPKTKKFLWRVQVYLTPYNPALERDVQDVFITSLSYDQRHNLLILSDERNRLFVVNLANRTVTPLQ